MRNLTVVCLAVLAMACLPLNRTLDIVNPEFERLSRDEYLNTYKFGIQGVDIKVAISSAIPGTVRVDLGITNRSHVKIEFDLTELRLKGDGYEFELAQRTIDRCSRNSETTVNLLKGKSWHCGLVFENDGMSDNCDTVDLRLGEIRVVGTDTTIDFGVIRAKTPNSTN